MTTIGIDIGAYQHAVAVCRDGKTEAERQVLRISADRTWFSELERLLASVGPVERVAKRRGQ